MNEVLPPASSDASLRAPGPNVLDAQYHYDAAHGVWRREAAHAFAYSDGDEVEERIDRIMTSAFDRSCDSEELERAITDWPSHYHLSGRRANLLRPVRHLLKGRILEIGAGAGAITRFLGECGASVTAVEGSLRRAAIAAKRCVDLSNVAVVADDFAAFATEARFDVVTLIGVLEYARRFFKVGDDDPIDALIARARGFLRPGGILIVAIENQLGLKYFAGCPEDHLGQAMVGLEDQYAADGVVTFGKAELNRRLAAGGLPHQQWWFPLPDYKLPVSLLSDRAVDGDEDLADLLVEAVNRDPQLSDVTTFSLERAWRPVFRNGLAGELANSFLVLSSESPLPPHKVLAAHYGDARRRAFRKEALFERDADRRLIVRRAPLYPRAQQATAGLVAIDLKDEAVISGEHWHAALVALLSREGWTLEQWSSWARAWFDALLGQLRLGGDAIPDPSHKISGHFLDAIPKNLVFARNGAPCFFDQEWVLTESMELGFLVYRGLFESLFAIRSCALPAQGVRTSRLMLFQHFVRTLGWEISPDHLRAYAELEARFQTAVNGGGKRPLDTHNAAIVIQPSSSWRPETIARLERELGEAVVAQAGIEQALGEARAALEALRAELEGVKCESEQRAHAHDAARADAAQALERAEAASRERDSALAELHGAKERAESAMIQVWAAQRRANERQEAVAAARDAAEHYARLLRGHCDRLKQAAEARIAQLLNERRELLRQLDRTERRPWRPLKHLLSYGVLAIVAALAKPVSSRAHQRLKKSADKRNPWRFKPLLAEAKEAKAQIAIPDLAPEPHWASPRREDLGEAARVEAAQP